MTITDFSGIRECVSALSDALDNFRADSPTPLASAVPAYVVVVTEVNDRLRTAHALLRQGRREESLHSCDAEPNLLDCVAELDASDQAIETWAPMLDELGIARPPKLLSDLAGELGAAYDVKHQLTTLMRSHRLLALGRGPLEKRVLVLRRIAAIDPDNRSWPEDLACYEGKCKTQLQAALEHAATLPADQVTPHTLAKATQVESMLCSADWLDPLSAEAIRRTRSSLKKIRQAKARVDLNAVAAGMAAALASSDLDQARALCTRWDELEALATLPADHPHAAAAAKCAAWVNEEANKLLLQERFEAASHDLARACGEGTPYLPRTARHLRSRLHTLLHEYESLAFGHDKDGAFLAETARRKLRTLDAVPLRFWSLLVAGLVLISTGMTAVTWRAMEAMQHARIVADARAEVIDRHYKNQDLVSAREAWAACVSAHEWLSAHPIASEVKTALERLGSLADDAKTSCTMLLDTVAESLDHALPSHMDVLRGALETDQLITDSIIQARNDARTECAAVERNICNSGKEFEALTAITGTASSKPLQLRLSKEKQRLRDVRSTLSDRSSAMAIAARSATDAALTRVDSLPVSLHAERKRELDSIRSHIDALERFTDGQEKQLHARIEGIEAASRSRTALMLLSGRLSDACGEGAIAFLIALGTEASRPDATAVAGDLTAVAAQKTSVESAQMWSDVAAAWCDRLPCDTASARRLEQRLERARGMSVQPAFDRDELQRLEQLSEYLADCTKDCNEPLQLLSDYLERPVMQPDVLVVNVGAKPYYTRYPEKRDGKCFRDERVVTRWNEAVKVAPEIAAPHAKLAKSLRDVIAAIKAGKTDIAAGMTSALLLFCTDKDAAAADPVVRCLLLSMVIDVLEGCAIYRDNPALESLGDKIDERVGTTPRWIDPEARDAQTVVEATEIVSKPQTLQDIEDTYRETLSRLQDRPRAIGTLAFIGWLDKTSEATLVRAHGLSDNARGSLRVVMPVNETSYECITIGNVQRGRIDLQRIATAQRFGCPIFLESEKSPRASGDSKSDNR